MAEWSTSQLFGEGRHSKFRRKLAHVLPDWQVFVRRRDGRVDQFTVRRGHQLALLAGGALVAIWAAVATTNLLQMPDRLAAKERELEDLLAANRAAQARLSSAEKLVGDIAHEVDIVHGNLRTLAESSDSLAKDPPGAKLSRVGAKTRLVLEPAYDEDGQPGSPETNAMREQVRRLQESLDRLHTAYTRAAQQTANAAADRISQTEQQISRLGIDAGRLIPAKRSPGQGGPFIPAHPGDEERLATDTLVERIQHWNGVKAAMQRLPLAVPIKGQFEISSGFGARVDPLNHRSAIHEGLDFGAPVGTPVYATGEGVVVVAQARDRYGNMVEINHGHGITTRYAHLSRIKVKPGQRVNRSTVIGLVGNTGRSTGPHLHYEIRVSDTPRDPIKFISVGRDAQKTR